MAVLSLLSLLTPVVRWRIRHLVPELWPMMEACLNMLEATWSWRADTTTGSREGPSQAFSGLVFVCMCIWFQLVLLSTFTPLGLRRERIAGFQLCLWFHHSLSLLQSSCSHSLTLTLTLIFSLSSTTQSQSIWWQLDFSLLPVSFSTSAPVSMTTYLSFEKMDKRCIEKEN
jgi:hypothetical protein